MLRLAAFTCLLARALLGDGGTVVLRAQAPPFVLTVFSAEAPQGRTDLSVLVQDSSTLAPVLDAEVSFESAGRVPAVLGRGQNKLLYSAEIVLPASGEWPYKVTVDRGAVHVSTAAVLRIAPAAPARLDVMGYVALVPVAILLFLLREYLLHRRATARAPNTATGEKT